MSSTSPTSSHPLDLLSNFFWTKKKFWEIEKKHALPWFWNSGNLDSEFMNISSFSILIKIYDPSKRFVTWDLTLETLIIYLTIENNDTKIFIVTLDLRVTVDSICNYCDVYLTILFIVDEFLSQEIKIWTENARVSVINDWNFAMEIHTLKTIRF